MYVEDWDSFLQMSEALFRQAPMRTRYVLKYRHCDGKLVLKVTDDVAVRPMLPRPAAESPSQSGMSVLAANVAIRPRHAAGSCRNRARHAARAIPDARRMSEPAVPLQCLKYYTDQQSDVRRVEQLNNLFFRLMAAGPDAPGAQLSLCDFHI